MAGTTGKFGEADTLARAKGTSVDGVQASRCGRSRRRQRAAAQVGGISGRLGPATDTRLPVWEALHQLIRAYNTDGDSGAAKVLAGVAGKAEAVRQLAYRLYTLCERARPGRGRPRLQRTHHRLERHRERRGQGRRRRQQRTLFDIEESIHETVARNRDSPSATC